MTLIHFGRMRLQRIIRKIKMINKMISPEINVPALKENSIVELPVSRIVSFLAHFYQHKQEIMPMISYYIMDNKRLRLKKVISSKFFYITILNIALLQA